MILLVLNVGSSSIKYAVFDGEKRLFDGLIEKIGDSEFSNHEFALNKIDDELSEKNISVDAIVHRVVHGGNISETKIIDDEILKVIKDCCDLAPLHNPHELNAIEICKKFDVPQVAVFDTAFFANLPRKAITYALPQELTDNNNIKRFGFHGSSHKFISENFSKGKTISCHLGSGCSVSAIDNGNPVDVSLGFSTLDGVVMGTRPGSLDSGILLCLLEKGHSLDELKDILYNKSGLKGISRISNDMRTLLDSNDDNAKLAIDVFVYSVQKFIGAYAAALNGLDTLAFTAGIGENSAIIRKRICENLTYLGLELDDNKNNNNEEIISTENSKVKVAVLKTDEELIMAREALNIL